MDKIKFSMFGHKRDTKAIACVASWEKLCKDFKRPKVSAKKDGQLFSPATFEPPYRKNENVRELSMLVLDIDHNAEFETLNIS
jgi:hypothetical protein